MPSAAVIDIDSLVSPVSEENPVGKDSRSNSSTNSAYYTVRDARTAARAAERKNLFDSHNNEAAEHWRSILTSAPDILKESKDLEIACWYTEALIRRHGYSGLRDGFIVIRQLLESFWDVLYPLPDEEDGMETRVSPLAGLNGEGAEGVLIAPIRNVQITEDHQPGPFNFWQYKQALEIQKISDDDTRREKAEKTGFSVEDIENVVAASSEEFYINLRDDITACVNEYRKISQLLDNYCGSYDAPPTSNIINTLEDVLSAIHHLARYKLPAEPVGENSDTEAGQASAESTPGGATVAIGEIRTRADAFRQLVEIASFFRKTEPHSPISYVIDKAVKWGDMSLNELIKELIPDSSSREFFSSLTGVTTDDD